MIRIKLFAIAILGILLSGCATQAPTLNFTPNDAPPVKNKVHAELKSITVSIAKEEEKLGDTQVGFFGNQYEQSFRTTFKDALEEAIVKSAVFNDLSDQKVSLTAKVMKFQTPSAGVTFETAMIVRYELIDRRTGQLVFRKDIESSGSVSFDYAFNGAIRSAEARNISVRNNISNFITSLEEVKLAAVVR